MTKREQLQSYIDETCDANPDYNRFYVEYRPNDGWWASPEEPRHFNDDGEYLGRDFKTALQTLKLILA